MYLVLEKCLVLLFTPRTYFPGDSKMKFKHMAPLLAFSTAVAVSFAEGKPAVDDDEYVDDDYYGQLLDNYDYGEDDYKSDVGSDGSDIKNLPNFVTRNSTFTVEIGTTIRLPCYVDRMPKNYVLLWHRIDPKNGKKSLVAIGNQVIASNGRISVEVSASGSNLGSSLIISQVKDKDGGEYICEKVTVGGGAIKHTVHIGSPPTIIKNEADTE